MEAFQGFLLLLFSLIGLCAGEPRVSAECNYNSLVVIVNRTQFDELSPIQPHQLVLGTGCPPNYVNEENLIFNYPVDQCGIETTSFPDSMMIDTRITYLPNFPGITAHLLLYCALHRIREQVIRNGVNTTEESIHCVTGIQRHWIWLMPFYGIRHYMHNFPN